jgi:hypothetical protein
MRRRVQTTGEQELISGERRLRNPGLHGFTCLFSQLKLDLWVANS